MKTKEEIEQKAVDFASDRKFGGGHGYPSFTASCIEKGYIEGYTQCQEDMADEIAQLKKSIQKAVDLMCEADEEIADLKEQLARPPKP